MADAPFGARSCCVYCSRARAQVAVSSETVGRLRDRSNSVHRRPIGTAHGILRLCTARWARFLRNESPICRTRERKRNVPTGYAQAIEPTLCQPRPGRRPKGREGSRRRSASVRRGASPPDTQRPTSLIGLLGFRTPPPRASAQITCTVSPYGHTPSAQIERTSPCPPPSPHCLPRACGPARPSIGKPLSLLPC